MAVKRIPFSKVVKIDQDSLGGNSKTTIIANVSPSICSANETLSTLKFAQRAKLIQNNAKVNEDASGDVIALQKQIYQLKDQLTFLLKQQNSLRSLSCQSPYLDQANLGDYDDERNLFLEGDISDSFNRTTVQIKKMENLEATLVGSLRREKKVQAAVKRLEAEIGHMNHLVKQREEDSQRTKMLLRFREEKIRRLELLADGLLSKDEYLMEENVALSEEIQLLHMKIDRHPELTRFALENIRLLEQLRMFQDFYEQGERETLLTEVSDLRDQLLYILDDQHAKFFPRITSQAETGFDQAASSAVQEEVEDTVKELEECRNSLRACLETNAKLTREVDDLRSQLENYSTCRKSAFHTVDGSSSNGNDTKEDTNKHSSVVPKTSGTDSEDRLASCKEVRDKLLQIQKDHKDAITFQPSDVQKELLDAKHLVEAMESQQIHLIEELDNLRQENKQYWKLLKNKYHDDIHHVIQLETHCELSESDMIKEELDNQDVDQKIERGVEKSVLQTNLESTHNELAEARILNRKYQDDQASQQLQNHELEQVREEVEVETAMTILHLQGELTALQQEVDSRNVNESSAVRHSLLLRAENQELEKRLCIMSQENIRLTSAFAAKEDEINTLVEEWEKATFDLTSFLVDGCLSLEEASEQIGSIVSLFSQRKNWIGEQVERAVKVFIEKEQTIVYLQKRLEEAQKMGMEMQLKLNSLKGATMAISEVQQQEKDENFKEVNQLKTLLSEKMFTIRDLGEKLENKEHQIIEAEKRANATLIALKWLYEMNDVNFGHGSVEKLLMNEPAAESLQRNSSIQRKDTDISESILHVKFQVNDINEESPKLVSSFGWHKDELQYIHADANARALGEIGAQVEMARQRVMESETAICASYLDTEKYLSSLLSDILCTSSAVRKMVHDLIKDVCAMKKKFMRLNDCNTRISCLELESPSREGLETSKLKKQYSLVDLVRGEIVKTNEKLDALKASIDTLSSVHRCTVKVGDPAIVGLNMLACRVCKTRWFQPRHEDCYSGHGIEEMKKIEVSSVDYFSSDFDISQTERDSEDEKDESLSSISCTGCSGRLEEQKWDVLLDRDSAFSCSDHGTVESQRPVSDLVCDEATAKYLKEEVESAFNSLMKIHGQLSWLLANNGVATYSHFREMSFCESFGGGTENPQLDTDQKEESNQLAVLDVGQMLQRIEQGMEKAEVGCCKTREMLCLKLNDARFAAEDKMKQANNLLLKFEEAQEIMKEAELMLIELLRINENAKVKINRWKQAGEELMSEKASLIEEVRQLKASIQLKDEQYESLKDQILANVTEITESISSLEEAFLQIQQNVEEHLMMLCSEILSLRGELIDCICTSRLWLERIWSQIMEKGFSMFVLYQCHVGAILEKLSSFNADSSVSQNWLSRSSSVRSNVGNICMNANGNFSLMNGTETVAPTTQSMCGLSVTGNSQEVLHAFQTFQHNPDEYLVEAEDVNFEGLCLLFDQKQSSKRVARLEEEKLAPTHDKNLLKEAISEQLIYLEKLCQESASLQGVSDGKKSSDCHFENWNLEIREIMAKAMHASISPCTHCSSLSNETPTAGPVIAENEASEAELGGVTVDRNTMFHDIQNLNIICAQMISLLDEKKDHPESPLQHKQGVHESPSDGKLENTQGRGMGLLDFPKIRTECGKSSIQEMVKLINKLFFVTGYIHSAMHVGTRNGCRASFLEILFQCICSIEEKACAFLASLPETNVEQNDVLLENLSLKRQLTRKEYLLEGLLFDFRLLQESTSNAKDIKDESEEMMASLSKVQHELVIKTSLIDDILIQYRELEVRLADRETALSSSKSELEQAKEALDMLSNDNAELRLLLEDLYIKKTDAEEQLEEKVKVVKDLEKEILRLTTSTEERILSSIQEIEDTLCRVTDERDQLQAEVMSLNDKLEMANAVADENEAIAVEARQVSEASKVYAEQKEEEVKILERSVEELECTINVLEKKVYEMGEEVERHRLMREDLVLELQALRERMLTVENVSENLDEGNSDIEEIMKDQLLRKIDYRSLELLEAKRYIRVLEKEKAEKAKEIKQCREYISELVLHAEAQALQYQQKYKTLEAMVCEAKTDPPVSNPPTSTLNRTDRSSIRPSSPFKCIASLVQQMNSEKDQELSVARLRIEELEALAATRQKEVCMLNARLLATESMTHDVIRDLLGVKMDMTNYANSIDQQQVQKLIEKAQQQTEESRGKEQEILTLRNQINDFIRERESWIEENNQRQADILAAQVRNEQLQLRDQLLTAQNEMLKVDKANLKRKITELDEMVREVFGSEGVQHSRQPTKIKACHLSSMHKEAECDDG